jgi:hypothetical protein
MIGGIIFSGTIHGLALWGKERWVHCSFVGNLCIHAITQKFATFGSNYAIRRHADDRWVC